MEMTSCSPISPLTCPHVFASPEDRLVNLPHINAPFEVEKAGTEARSARWRKVRVLGEDKNGNKVLLVENMRMADGLGLPAIFVVKCAKKECVLDSDSSKSKLFQNEVRAALHLSDLASQNVVKTYGAWQDETKFYLATEYCDGGELFTAYHSGGLSQRAERCALVKQMLQAVCDVQARGVAHQDVRLENFLITKAGIVKLKNFSGARHNFVPSSGSAVMPDVESHSMPGNLRYLPPELLGKRTDSAHIIAQKVDAFQIGVAIYTFMVGQYPYAAGQHHLFRSQGDELMGRPDAELMPRNCLDMVKQLMASDPASRLSVDRALEHPWLDVDKRVPDHGADLGAEALIPAS